MIYGIGIDLIEIDRIRQVIERNGRRFIDRIYTESEQAYCAQRPSYARPRFASPWLPYIPPITAS